MRIRVLKPWRWLCLLAFLVAGWGTNDRAQGAKAWTMSTYLGFSSGTLADGGANTYVAADGTIRLINQWDLNHDGNVDLVVPSGHDNNEKVDLYVYWGGKSGFDAARRTSLPTNSGVAVAIADLNGDGYGEVILANAYRVQGQTMLGVRDIMDTAAINSYIYWGSKDGYSAERRTDLPTVGARSVAVGDLNHDGRPDIVFANSTTGGAYSDWFTAGTGGSSYIYWGSAEGYSSYQRTPLPTLNASYVAIDDLNGDRFPDLIFANKSDGRTNEIKSYIYWGSEKGFSAQRRTELPTLGAVGLVAGDLNGDGQKDLVFANKSDGTAGQGVDAWLYWGDEHGQFTPSRRQSFPTGLTDTYLSVDINADGYVDLYVPGNYVFWGGPGGFNPARKSPVPHEGYIGRIADFDRDGYLDLLVSEFKVGSDRNVRLYYGGPGGFNPANYFPFQIGGTQNVNVADLNGDGWLDVIVSTEPIDEKHGGVTVYWNSPGGFSNDRKTTLATRAGDSVQVADLNRDGQLDLIVASSFDPDPPAGKPLHIVGSPEGGTQIFWGSREGFSEKNSLILPSVGSTQTAVADLNNDGYLDLVAPAYNGGTNRTQPSSIFWNSAKGFDPERKTLLPTLAACGVLVADFNRDGYKDIFFANHAKDGNHRTDAYLYWGGASGFSADRKTLIPSRGIHFMNFLDPGNVYDRSDRYDYISPPHQGKEGTSFERLNWQGDTPFRTRLEFQVRTAETRDGLMQAAWRGPEGPHSYYTVSGTELKGLDAGRWMQYKASLISPESANTPILRAVSVGYQ